MSHEINDNISRQHEAEHNQSAEALFLKVHENDRQPSAIEEIGKRLEANERAIVEALERVAEIAKRALLLQNCGEPHLFETIKEWAHKGAEAGEPAYQAFYKHLFH
jgi:hypothetical protein